MVCDAHHGEEVNWQEREGKRGREVQKLNVFEVEGEAVRLQREKNLDAPQWIHCHVKETARKERSSRKAENGAVRLWHRCPFATREVNLNTRQTRCNGAG